MKKANQYIIIFSVLLILLVAIKFLSDSRYNSILSSPIGYSRPDTFGSYEGYEDVANKFAPVVGSPVLIVFSQENNLGNTSRFTGEQSNLVKYGFNDRINSFTLGPYSRVKFYEHVDFQGRAVTYSNQQDLNLNITTFKEDFMKGQASSFKLELIEPYIIAYDGQNLGGSKTKVFGRSSPILTTWDKQLVSFIISPFTKVTVYDKGGFSGNAKEFKNSTSVPSKILYVGSDWINRILSIKIEQLFIQ
jgi:hypothetical protein